MTDYISREAFLERVDGIWDCADMVFEPNDKCCRTDDCASCKWRETKNAIRKIVAYIPAADVRPVVKAQIVDMRYAEDDGEWKCTHCGWQYTLCVCGKDVTSKIRFCPNCGADMRAEEGE